MVEYIIMEELIIGRIYVLKSFQTSDVYIGSTIQTLKARLSNHKSKYKLYENGKDHYRTSNEIVKYDDCYIELIKEVCCTKNQLLILEGEEIVINPKSINNKIAGHPLMYETVNEYEKIRRKTTANKEINRQNANIRQKENRENNKEKINEYKRQWNSKNKDWVNEYKKQWRLKQKLKNM